MSNIITIVSTPHTGIHSVIELFMNKGYHEVSLDKFANGVIKLDETKTNLVRGHIYEKNIQTIKNLNEISQIIVPIRDPLLSLISAYARQKPQNISGSSKLGGVSMNAIAEGHISTLNKGMERQLASWGLWSNEIFKMNPFHAPLDLGVDHLKYGDVWFKDIGIHNTKGGYPLKQAYYSRDLSYIESKLNDNLDALISMGDVLRSPLEKLGYKDLLWWS